MGSAVDAGFPKLASKRERGAARVSCISRAPPITLDQGIELDARESFSKPRERPKFSSPYLKRFGLARARSGPDARDEARTGSVPV